MEIKKTIVTAKSRALKATWTFEAAQDAQSQHGIDVEAELADLLSAEINKELLMETYRAMGMIEVKIPKGVTVPDEWSKLYLNGDYKWCGQYWFFNDEKDATFFTLKWSSKNE